MSMYHVHSAQGGQKRASDPETGVTDSCEQPYWCWELNMVLLEEQSMFLAPEPSLQPLCHLYSGVGTFTNRLSGELFLLHLFTVSRL